MMGQGDLAARLLVTLDFVAAGTRAVKGEAQDAKLTSNLAILEARQAAH